MQLSSTKDCLYSSAFSLRKYIYIYIYIGISGSEPENVCPQEYICPFEWGCGRKHFQDYRHYLLPAGTICTATESHAQVTSYGNQEKLLHVHSSLQCPPTTSSGAGDGESPPRRRSQRRSLQISTESQLCWSQRIRDPSRFCPPGWKMLY